MQIPNEAKVCDYCQNNHRCFKKAYTPLKDDIITTCATVNECSRVLSKYAQNVYATALARVW